MPFTSGIYALFLFFCIASTSISSPLQQPLTALSLSGNHNVSVQLFAELEELARIVDIAYCVGVTGIRAPFECASRCSDFKGYQLVDTWNTGPLMSDSCGYIVLDHNGDGRIIMAFRGTYSIANTIVDLSTVPQEYVPYPGDPDESGTEDLSKSYLDLIPRPRKWLKNLKWLFGSRNGGFKNQDMGENHPKGPKCNNCTVHSGFLTSWKNTRELVLPHLNRLHDLYPAYDLHLVGHSLGGAVAGLAGLEFAARGHRPTVTTFGEPRLGNKGLRQYLDTLFELDVDGRLGGRYRRVTHANDPIPLLPLSEWGYLMHGGEIFIAKPALQPGVSDLRLCDGDEDSECIEGSDEEPSSLASSIISSSLLSAEHDFNSDAWNREAVISEGEIAQLQQDWGDIGDNDDEGLGSSGGDDVVNKRWGLPARYRLWQLFFAHRDYFWRLGLCLPGGDPFDWGRERYPDPDPEPDDGTEEL